MQITPEILSIHRLTQEEYDLIVKQIGRTPNLEELGVFSAMWSEHCGYKNTKPLLKKLPTQGPRVVHGPGENAGVIDIDDNDAIAFKIESHNHPSAVDPYNGAATGVGGVLRDIFTMGARPIAVLDSLRFGQPHLEQTQHLIKGVKEGLAGYGNVMGIPTLSGEVFFDKTYNQNILVNAMCVGLVKKDKIITSKASGIGNWLVYYGAATGKDGVHGASFASVKLEEEKPTNTIPKGNPHLEKAILEATLELIEKNLIIAGQDMGAAGITSSCTEMGAKGGNGVKINLDALPKEDPNITPYEMLLSETQERMVALIDPANWDKVKAVLDFWKVNGVVVGEIVEGKNFEVVYQGKKVVDLPLKAIVDGVPFYEREVLPKPQYFNSLKSIVLNQKTSLSQGLKTLLASPNIAAKHWLYQDFDFNAGQNTVVSPGVAGASVVKIPHKNKGLALCTDGNSRFIYLNPEKGTMIAVCEAARNVSALGALPIAITNGLNFGDPTHLDIYYQLVYSLQGMGKACEALKTPITGGNASLFNEGAFGSIYPTPIIGMVGLLKDLNLITTPHFKDKNHLIYLLGTNKEEIDGSEFAQVFYNNIGKNCPDIDLDFEAKVQKGVQDLIAQKLLQSADDISLGGLGVALAKGSIKGEKGFDIQLNSPLSLEATWFGETQSRFIISLKKEDQEKVESFLKGQNIPFTLLGNTTLEPKMVFTFNGQKEELDLKELKEIYTHSFEKALTQK